jgi:hypothetical protein
MGPPAAVRRALHILRFTTTHIRRSRSAPEESVAKSPRLCGRKSGRLECLDHGIGKLTLIAWHRWDLAAPSQSSLDVLVETR